IWRLSNKTYSSSLQVEVSSYYFDFYVLIRFIMIGNNNHFGVKLKVVIT
ncbi:Transcription elongation factor mitochondrial, partial [Bienertia sinuspersici]